MGIKYIIDIENIPFIKDEKKLFKATAFNTLVFDENGLDKLERLNDDYINEHYGMFQDAAYQKGLEEGKKQQEKADAELISEYKNGSYQDGLSDAWEAAKKIAKMDAGKQFACFGEHFSANVFGYNTASEAIEKIREYEAKQKAEDIKVGDEVEHIDSKTKMWVIKNEDTNGTGYKLDGISAEGNLYVCKNAKKWRKTGRHLDQIAEVLERMKEETK